MSARGLHAIAAILAAAYAGLRPPVVPRVWRTARLLLLSLLAAAAMLVSSCGGERHPQPQSTPGPRLTPAMGRALDRALHEKVASTGIPGASAAVVFANGREWSGAAGKATLHPARSMTPDTSMPFDSVTKVATAALALRLVEQHRLRLDDPIRRWYPAWNGDPAATVRDLLGHTSGLDNPPDAFWRSVAEHPRRPVSDRQFIAATPKPGPRTTAGQYSNTGFVIAGRILQSAAHAPLATAMRRDVFQGPGGDGLALEPTEVPHPPRDQSYWYPHGLGDPVSANDGSALLPSRAWAGMAGAAGGLAGDVPSLARWAHGLLGGHVLSAASLAAMTHFHEIDNLDGYGLGLIRDSFNGRVMWGHDGDGLGSHTELWHLPKQDLTIAVSWNDDAVDRDGNILPALLDAVFVPR